jgi:uncharacterized protein YdhG (YjbR/CyaY superfamily)
MSEPPAESVDDYLAAQPAEVRDALAEVRRRILLAAPGAVESIRYGMPAYRLANGHPVYFAGWQQHLSLHDVPVLDADLEAELAPFRSGKDTLKFRYRDTVPMDLIGRTVAAIAARPA